MKSNKMAKFYTKTIIIKYNHIFILLTNKKNKLLHNLYKEVFISIMNYMLIIVPLLHSIINS